jgi:deoxycytidine triphosphate deaminase
MFSDLVSFALYRPRLASAPVILSDRTIREELAAGRIEIEPLGDRCIQPSSVDLHIDRYFRVFRNHTMRVIDVKEDQEELTELVEIKEDDAFILHPGEFVLGSTLERVKLPDDLVGRLEGKALAVDTAVPTPSGWKSMGELQVGDLVFDETGQPTRIVAVTDQMTGRPCREVVFSDGQSIVADLAHEWVTTTKNARKHHAGRRATVTTAEIERQLRWGSEWNHHVELAAPVQYSTRVLPLDPYVLGIWLGDGTSTCAHVTTADPEVLDEIRAAGYGVQKANGRIAYRIGGVGHTRDEVNGRYSSNGSLNSLLRALGLFGNKHIPSEFLQADVEQRTALLQGLMDSDGFVDEMGRAEFCNMREVLADGVVELVASLGMRPRMRKKTARLNGVDVGTAYLVHFTPDRPVFRLPRKLSRQKRSGAFHRFRAIVAVRPVASVPVRCIEVASPSGMFLVGPTFIPTHNSSLGRLGLLIHSTAGFVDAGWDGQLTLELSNVSTLPITLYPGMKIGQISFIKMTTPAEHPYGSGEVGSKYQHQVGPRPSRYFENFRDKD